MRRLFIESDVLKEDEYRTAQRRLHRIFRSTNTIHIEEIFDETVAFAWHKADNAWEAVKRADEIYANSGLVPLCGYGTYTGSVVVFDVMMQKAIDEGIEGKSVYFLREIDDIDWEAIDLKLLDVAFRKNYLYTIKDLKFEQVDIDALLRKFK